MDKLFGSVSSLWVLFIPLLSVSKVGMIESIEDCHQDTDDKSHKIIVLIKQLGELLECGLITKEEFDSKKQTLLDMF